MDRTTKQQIITAARRSSGYTYFARGEHYYRDGRVMSVRYREGVIESEVIGRGSRIYQQRIDVHLKPPLQVEGECSCPVQFDCKHVIAALLAWLEQPEGFTEHAATAAAATPSATEQLQRWQRQFEQRREQQRNISAPRTTDQEQLHYLLDFGTPQTRLQVRMVRSRQLRHGGWSQPYDVSTYELSQYLQHQRLPAWIQLPEDGTINQLLLLGNAGFGHHPPRTPHDQRLLLQQLIATGRCHWQQLSAPPLTIGAPRQVTFHWHKEAAGYQLQINLESASDWLLLATEPLWYLDSIAGSCGELQQPLPPDLFQALHELPLIPLDQLRSFTHFLLRWLPALDAIPLPEPLPVVQIQEVPTPVLRLWGEQSRFSGQQRYARLLFRYGDCELAPYLTHVDHAQTELKTQGERIYQIERDIAFEEAALARLKLCQPELQPQLIESEAYDLRLTHHNRLDEALAWQQLLDQLPQLEAEGWQICRETGFLLTFTEADQLQVELTQTQPDWFDLNLSFQVGEQRIELLPLITQWLRQDGQKRPDRLLIERQPGEWITLPSTLLRHITETLTELYDTPPGNPSLKLSRYQVGQLALLDQRLDDYHLQWQGGEPLRRLGEQLRNFEGISEQPPPAALNATLRAYQQHGLNWLQFLRQYQFGGILADDMGLGKTLQTLTHLLVELQAGRLLHPALVVAPTSLLGNWRREAALFTPQLQTCVLHGADRHTHFGHLQRYQLLITSYTLLARDSDQWQQQRLSYLILDEAQTIKNPRAKSALAARQLKVNQRICLTGTPLENHLGELWALFDFLMPGFLGSQQQFNRRYRYPIERHHDTERQYALTQRITPFMLRRTKQAVASELPPKSEMVRSVEMEPDQRRLYETIRTAMAQRVQQLLADKGLRRSHIELLDALLKLRQVCCDPRLVKLESARRVKHSAKLELLLAMLPPLLEEGRRILIFSQFSTMLGHIETALQQQRIDYVKLTGSTRDRDAVIERFQRKEVPIFLISLKAGGTGLNLTQADTVIHYDPWWNPAAEAQATDRAHRIGQDKPVFVYKLIVADSVEEKILALQQRKQALADAIYRDTDDRANINLTADEMLALFAAD